MQNKIDEKVGELMRKCRISSNEFAEVTGADECYGYCDKDGCKTYNKFVEEATNIMNNDSAE
jgi:hypothetical protein